ncbi:MAG: P27 family phage terminase small subunit [Oscillospiraceae bacterium]|nr:P27 family phage terminase small subunit [Oscillospiraceae bacterium]
MARPAKPVSVQSSHLTKKEISERTASENALKGNEVRVPKGITASQKMICRHIIGELEKSGILCSLDEYVLEQCAVAVDCLHKINSLINSEDEKMMLSKELLTAKEKYEKTFFRCCDELCLSPQARAKIANINAQTDDGTELLRQILSGGDSCDGTE